MKKESFVAFVLCLSAMAFAQSKEAGSDKVAIKINLPNLKPW